MGLGFDMDNYYQESFGAPVETKEEAPELDDVEPDDAVSAELNFTALDVVYKCAETDTVLATAKVAGLNIPSGCTFGVCGTCKVKKTEGDIFACCSNPTGKIAVEI